MILCLKGNELGNVIYMYFLSIKAKNGIKNHKFFEAALRRTNLLFPWNSRQVGCAGIDGVDGQYRLVCRYSPSGNVRGQSAF